MDDEQDTNSICNKYYVSNFPTSILINPEGTIIYRGYGQPEFPILVSEIDGHISTN